MVYGRAHYTQPIALGLGTLGDVKALDAYFEAALALPGDTYIASLDYARGLALAGDPRAEKWFTKAISAEPHGLASALAYYAEWLLDHGREAGVLPLIADDVSVQYVHFLKGVALERLGRASDAEASYARFRDFSADFPAPARYRIDGSPYQVGIYFVGDALPRYSMAEALAMLSRVIASEAESESVGQQRAVGWTARTRVFLAYTVSTSCGGYPTGVWGQSPPISRWQTSTTRYSQLAPNSPAGGSPLQTRIREPLRSTTARSPIRFARPASPGP